METTATTRNAQQCIALGKYLGAMNAEQALILAMYKVTDSTARAGLKTALAEITALTSGYHALYMESFDR
jgi:hypothetical protein